MTAAKYYYSRQDAIVIPHNKANFGQVKTTKSNNSDETSKQ